MGTFLFLKYFVPNRYFTASNLLFLFLDEIRLYFLCFALTDIKSKNALN